MTSPLASVGGVKIYRGRSMKLPTGFSPEGSGVEKLSDWLLILRIFFDQSEFSGVLPEFYRKIFHQPDNFIGVFPIG